MTQIPRGSFIGRKSSQFYLICSHKFWEKNLVSSVITVFTISGKQDRETTIFALTIINKNFQNRNLKTQIFSNKELVTLYQSSWTGSLERCWQKNFPNGNKETKKLLRIDDWFDRAVLRVRGEKSWMYQPDL